MEERPGRPAVRHLVARPSESSELEARRHLAGVDYRHDSILRATVCCSSTNVRIWTPPQLPALRYLIREVGAERVMIGSDYCYAMGYDRPLQFLEQIDINGEQRAKILGGTAATLLKL